MKIFLLVWHRSRVRGRWAVPGRARSKTSLWSFNYNVRHPVKPPDKLGFKSDIFLDNVKNQWRNNQQSSSFEKNIVKFYLFRPQLSIAQLIIRIMWVWLNCAWCMDMTSPSQTKTQKEEAKLLEVCQIICFDPVVDHSRGSLFIIVRAF